MAAVSAYEDSGAVRSHSLAVLVSPKKSSMPGQIPGAQGTESPSGSPYKDLLVVPATRSLDLASTENASQCDNHIEDNEIFKKDYNAPCASVAVGSCDACGQRAIKIIFCGKEWCSHCGQEGSPTHKDRYSKWLSRAHQMTSMGYFVIEWPLRYRHDKKRVYSAAGLRETYNKVVEILAGKRMGRRGRVGGYFTRGLMRWHWFGDKNKNYNPHLNILVDSGYIAPDKLQEIKSALRHGLQCSDLIINYSFRSTPGEMAHTCRYVTRPTFHDREADSYMAHELFETVNENDVVVAFRNSRMWGKWDQPEVWSTSGDEKYKTIDKLRNNNQCPCCQGKMSWSEPMDKRYLKVVASMGILKPIVRGYYEFKPNDYIGQRGLDEVYDLNGVTGELVPVNVKDVMRIKTLRGDYDRLDIFVKMARQRVKFLNQLKALGIPVKASVKKDAE